MRPILIGTGILIAVFTVYGVDRYRRSTAPAEPLAGRHIVYYVDPMHPSYRSDKPGIAPDCGMKLEPVWDGPDHKSVPKETKLSSAAVQVDDDTQRLIGLTLASAERTSEVDKVETVGRVYAEDSRTYKINSGVDGFIRETFQDSTGTLVEKDQRLATFYAPEILAATSGFLAANERVPGSVTPEGTRSIQNYTDRLRNLGMSEPQIKRLAATRQFPESVDIVSPSSGMVVTRNVSPGQHFEHDMILYEVADLSKVWVIAEVDQQDQPFLKPGCLATVRIRDSAWKATAHLTASLPESDPAAGTLKLRLETDNPRLSLRPNMLVDVEFAVRRPASVTVPLDALVDSGVRSRVYVARQKGIFEPREVETGWRRGDRAEITAGIQAGERVVANATFLIDSESRLRSDVRAAKP